MNQGLFELLIMFFGLCNSLATFQTMMNDILHPFIDHNEAICYMDDILIYSTSLTDPPLLQAVPLTREMQI